VHFVDHVVVGNYKIWILIFGIHVYLRKNVAVASDLAILRVILLLLLIINNNNNNKSTITPSGPYYKKKFAF
jgi:hypothetical protein